MRDSWGSFFSLLGGTGVVQMGQDVVGLWAAEASSLVAQSPEVAKGGKEGGTGWWGAHFTEAACAP